MNNSKYILFVAAIISLLVMGTSLLPKQANAQADQGLDHDCDYIE